MRGEDCFVDLKKLKIIISDESFPRIMNKNMKKHSSYQYRGVEHQITLRHSVSKGRYPKIIAYATESVLGLQVSGNCFKLGEEEDAYKSALDVMKDKIHLHYNPWHNDRYIIVAMIRDPLLKIFIEDFPKSRFLQIKYADDYRVLYPLYLISKLPEHLRRMVILFI